MIMNIDRLHIYNLYKKIGIEKNLSIEIICGKQSHADMWHACSILEHVRWCVALAEFLVTNYTLSEELLIAAYWHDIGKVTAPQINRTDITFHGHAKSGAIFLKEHRLTSDRVIRLVQDHGNIIKGEYSKDTDELLLMLDMCDEFSKWSEKRFPIAGSNKQRENRKKLLCKFAAAGISYSIIETLSQNADKVADSIELLTKGKEGG